MTIFRYTVCALLISSSILINSCGVSKETPSSKKDYESIAADNACDCIKNSGLSFIESRDSCLADGMVKANKEVLGDENAMPYSGLPDMQEGMKIVMVKIQTNCGN